jgi:hypothetical protein
MGPVVLFRKAMSYPTPWQSYTTFTELGGRAVGTDEVIEELRRLALDAVLGFLGRLSLAAAQPGSQFFEPSVQGGWLNLAIVDDFPVRLPGAVEMYQPGRVPTTGGRHTFIHQRNVAWLAHYAILYCRRDVRTVELTPSLQERCCRLLLIANDFFAEPHVDPTGSLADARTWALQMLRLQQFMDFTVNGREAVRSLAREWLLFADFLPRHFDVDHAFQDTTGLKLAEYFDVLAVFIPYVFHTLALGGNPWQSRSALFKDLDAAHDVAQRVLDGWVTIPSAYVDSAHEFTRQYPLDADALEHFDYVALQATPIIEARLDELMIPVLPYLYSKPTDEPYFRLAHDNAFRTAYGLAYEDYAHSLLERIGTCASDGPWKVWRSPPQLSGEEYCDTVLVNGQTALVFEHKGGRLHSAFLRGGEGDRVLGPPKATLEEIDLGMPLSVRDLKARDKALLTRGLWQLGSSQGDLVRWTESETGRQITVVRPLLTHHARARVDEVLRLPFLNRLVRAVRPFSDARWQAPEWAHVSELEALACVAEHGGLRLGDFLARKATATPNSSLESFIRREYSGFPLDPVLDDTAKALMIRAAHRFWPGRAPPPISVDLPP